MLRWGAGACGAGCTVGGGVVAGRAGGGTVAGRGGGGTVAGRGGITVAGGIVAGRCGIVAVGGGTVAERGDIIGGGGSGNGGTGIAVWTTPAAGVGDGTTPTPDAGVAVCDCDVCTGIAVDDAEPGIGGGVERVFVPAFGSGMPSAGVFAPTGIGGIVGDFGGGIGIGGGCVALGVVAGVPRGGVVAEGGRPWPGGRDPPFDTDYEVIRER